MKLGEKLIVNSIPINDSVYNKIDTSIKYSEWEPIWDSMFTLMNFVMNSIVNGSR